MHVAVTDLPPVVQQALKSVDYGRKDIRVEARTSVTLSDSPGDGRRAFVTLVNLTAGTFTTVHGSWGGPNMFDRTNVVDNDHRPVTLPPDGLAIQGNRGGSHPVYATIYVSASMVDRMLPGPAVELTTVERDALYCHNSLKGGAYRKDELRRRKVDQATLDSLVERGFLNRNKAGAMSITTAGKNAVGEYGGY